MKTFRILGSIFIIFGFFFALLGILSVIFPLIENEHFRLILNSFQETSTDMLTNTLNIIVRFCLSSSYFLLLCGISLMVTGGLISSTAHKRQSVSADIAYDTQPISPSGGEVLGIPKPAYYPGGLEPSSPDLTSVEGIKYTLLNDDDPIDSGMQSAPTTNPISGGIEPSYLTDDNDAQKLMQHDQMIQIQNQPEQQPSPDYTQYVSNSITKETQNDTGKYTNQPADTAKINEADQPSKPRIISTIGKRKF